GDAEVLALVAEQLLRGRRDRAPVDLAPRHRGQLLDLGLHLLEQLVVRDVRARAAVDRRDQRFELRLAFVDDVVDRHGSGRISALRENSRLRHRVPGRTRTATAGSGCQAPAREAFRRARASNAVAGPLRAETPRMRGPGTRSLALAVRSLTG